MEIKKSYFQWDINQYIPIKDKYCDFVINNEVYRLEAENGNVKIPDECFLTSGRKFAYICYEDGTRCAFAFNVTARPMPPDYVYTETEKITFDALVAEVNALMADLSEKAENGYFDGKPGKDGDNGTSPTVSIVALPNGHKVKITDVNGEKSFDVLNGSDYVLTEADKEYIASLVHVEEKTYYIENPYDDAPLKQELSELSEEVGSLNKDISDHAERIEQLENEPKVPQSLIDDVNDVKTDLGERLKITSVAKGLALRDGELSIIKPTTFEEIQLACRQGIVKDLLEIGETRTFAKDGVTYEVVVMDFIENGKHSDGLQLTNGLKNGVIFQTDKIMYNLQFDEREAFYYAPNGLPVGTYHFKLGQHSWMSADVGKSFQFTLPVALPAGGQLVFVQAYNATLDGAKINMFSGGASTTSIGQATMSIGTGGTDLGTLNNTINGNFNSCQRSLFGSNRWLTSAMRQHLNSGAAGQVWNPQTNWDRPPSWLTTTKGFLNGLSSQLADYIHPVIRHTYRNTLCDGGGIDETVENIFLPSRRETFCPAEGSDDTNPFAFYRQNSISQTETASAETCRIKLNQAGTAYYWWLQSPGVGHASSVRIVTQTGAIDSGGASNSLGVAPAFVIA